MQDLLDRTLDFQNIHQAWEAVAENQGIPGVDGVSLRQWQRNWEERLRQVIVDVRANRYRPHPLRRRMIPKTIPGEYRLLRIPTVRDRILQRAVLQILHPVFEPIFLDCSFGYRPNRGLLGAVQRIIVLRENGYRCLLDADIDAFFDHVDHPLLLSFLKQDLPDDSLLPLVRAWLDLGRIQPDQPVGIPLGSPLSPLWANVLLHRLDEKIARRGWPLVRYADDFIVFAEELAARPRDQRSSRRDSGWLKLSFEPNKTSPASFAQGFDFLGVHFEGDEYRYLYLGEEVVVRGEQVDRLFSYYDPEY